VNIAEKIFPAFGNTTSVLAARIFLFADNAMMLISTLHTSLNLVEHFLEVLLIYFCMPQKLGIVLTVLELALYFLHGKYI
jgi:hypothetical protein